MMTLIIKQILFDIIKTCMIYKNNPNSDYDQINFKFNKKIGKSKAHARLNKKIQTNKKQMKISFSFF